jgi:hypothetical protein
MEQRHLNADPTPERIAKHIRAIDAEMIKQAPRIFRHDREAVGLRVMGFGAFAMAAIIECDDPAAGRNEVADPRRGNPVHAMVRRKPVNEEGRRTGAFIHEGDLDTV